MVNILKLSTIVAVVGVLFSLPFVPDAPKIPKHLSRVVLPPSAPLTSPAPVAPPATAQAQSPASEIEVMVLKEANTIVFRGVVSGETVAEAQQEFQRKSAALKDSDIIYLVLDTPGGSVEAGNSLIDLARALPQKVKTITLFAASMGFHIAQNLDERLVLPNGEYMSHRIRAGEMGGEIPGSLVVRVQHLMRLSDLMDSVAATRMNVTSAEYKDLIKDEYWIYGSDAIQARVADRVVLARCDSSFSGTKDMAIQTVFGEAILTFSACPLIRSPLKIKFDALTFPNQTVERDFKDFIDTLFYNPELFTQDYIETGKFQKFLPF